MGKILKLALFLAVVAGLSGAALSFVYQQTDPIIQVAAIAKVKENLVKMYDGGQDFRSVDTNFGDYTSLVACYEVLNGSQTQGYVYEVNVVGYGGASTPIKFLIALDNEGTYKGYEVTDCSGETKGFGSQVGEDAFKNSIVGKDIGSAIDTISGSTISSQAVVDGINQATAHYNENFK